LLAGQVRVGKGSRDPRAAAVARLALLDELGLGLPGAAVGALTAVDDHRHVRVGLVVLDHLLVELRLELARDHAIDHLRLIVGRQPVCARPAERFGNRRVTPPRERATPTPMPSRRQLAWLAPLAAAIVAGGIVAALSFGGSTHPSAVAAAPLAGRQAHSFQSDLVSVVKALSP